MVMVIVALAVLVALLPAVTQPVLGHSVSILPYDPNYYPSPCPSRTISTLNGSYETCTLPPSLAHLLGTDNLGRDMLSRVLAALPLDLAIAFSVTGFAALAGGALGLVSGYWDRPGTIGGVLSVVVLRLTDIFLAFPSLLLALAIAATLGRGTVPSVLAILLTWWPYYVRLARGEVLVVKHLPYVVAAKAAGVSNVRILFRHVLRNILEPVVVYYTLDVGTVLVTFSTISFIGIGVPLNVPEWGNMVEYYYTQNLMGLAPWTILAAGGAIFVTALAFSLLGDGLRDVLDPRSRRALFQVAVPATVDVGAAAPAEA
jgi:peptide/nickel transport system permease protein